MTAVGMPRFVSVTVNPFPRSWRAATCTYPVPLGQSTNGTHSIEPPWAVASLAPTAVYTIFEPAAGGAVGIMGLLSPPSPNLSQATDAVRHNVTAAIHEIGMRRVTSKDLQRKYRTSRNALIRMAWIGKED